VSTASGICHTVTAICRYRGRVGTSLSVLWVAYHPKHVEQFPDKINVASCWIYIRILLRCTDPWTFHLRILTHLLRIVSNDALIWMRI
jgi:hypothetical protein